MSDSVYAVMSTLLTEKFGAEASTIRPDASLQALGLDSLALMEFVFAVEDVFNLRIPEERLDPREAGVTLQQVADIIEDMLKQKQSPGLPAGAAA